MAKFLIDSKRDIEKTKKLGCMIENGKIPSPPATGNSTHRCYHCKAKTVLLLMVNHMRLCDSCAEIYTLRADQMHRAPGASQYAIPVFEHPRITPENWRAYQELYAHELHISIKNAPKFNLLEEKKICLTGRFTGL